jgi:hypothetical protein
MRDHPLRFVPQRFSNWSESRAANTALGTASFLILVAIGATLLVQYGFANAFWAIVATGLSIFLAGRPISVYAAHYGVDMDLLIRGVSAIRCLQMWTQLLWLTMLIVPFYFVLVHDSGVFVVITHLTDELNMSSGLDCTCLVLY